MNHSKLAATGAVVALGPKGPRPPGRALGGALLGVTLFGVTLWACATDNGQTVYGDQYAPNAKVDASQDASPAFGDAGDAAGEAAPKDAQVDAPACGRAAVIAGDAASLSGSLQIDGAAWAGGNIVGGAAVDPPRIVAFGPGFFAATRGPADALQTLVVTGAFGVPTARGQAALKSGPSLAVVGTMAHVVYAAGPSYQFFHGSFDGTTWNPVGLDEAVGTPPAVGNSSAALASAGPALAFVQAGTNNGLYFNVSDGTWATAIGIAGAGAYAAAAPAMVATPGSANDLVVVYVEKTTHVIQWTARDAVTKTFGAPANVDALAKSIDDLSLARVVGGDLVLAYRGEDGKGYVSRGTASGAGIAWSAPAPIVPGGVAVDSTPSVASGVCGDDAILVYASAGAVRATRAKGTTWSASEPVTGAAGTRVSVATRL